MDEKKESDEIFQSSTSTPSASAPTSTPKAHHNPTRHAPTNHTTRHKQHGASFSPHAAKRKKNNTMMWLLGAVVVIVIIAIIVANPFGAQNGKGTGDPVKSGDSVTVDYVGRLDDGTVFDTSKEIVARTAGVYTQARTYQPLLFTVGTGEMIAGFDQGVVGMRVGETKTIVIPPEQAYGPHDPTRIRTIPRKQQITRETEYDRNVAVLLAQFTQVFGSAPEIGKTYTNPTIPFPYSVLSVNDTSVVISMDVEVGEILTVPPFGWNATVIEVTNTNVAVLQSPVDGSTINTDLGKAIVGLGSENITITLESNKGDKIQSQAGSFVVSDVTDDSITVDLNHPLAGKTLTFEITLVSVSKGTA